MARQTDSTIPVSNETKQIIEDFKQTHSLTYEEAMRTLIRNSLCVMLEDGFVPTPGDDMSGAVQIGAECEKCDNRVLSVPNQRGQTAECSQCGWNWFSSVCHEMDIVMNNPENDDELSFNDMIANTVPSSD